MHRTIAAWLAIIFGVLGLPAFLVGLALAIGGPMLVHHLQLPAWLAVIGPIGGFFFGLAGLFALLDIVAGVGVLRGSRALAQTWLIISSVISLLKFPLGTAIGAYTLWALMREPAEPPPAGSVQVARL